MTSPLTEGRHPAEFIVSEANGRRSRDVVTVASGAGVLVPGTVLGKLARGDATAAAKSGGNTGDATISAVTLGAGAKVGVYTVRHTTATNFDVFDPDGFKLTSGTAGSAYDNDVGFTITAGSTPMVAGDGFDITVAAGSGKFVMYDQDADDGSEVAAGVLMYGVDATSADVDVTALVRDAELNGGELVWPADITEGETTTAVGQLADAGLIVR